MFHIHTPEGDTWVMKKTRVVDTERNIELQFRNLTGQQPGKAFVLSHGDMNIPFHTERRSDFYDAETGKPYFVPEIVSFGTSIYLKGDRNVPDYHFARVEDAAAWLRIAAEAILVFGVFYDGFNSDPEYARVLLNGETLTRRDFGYTK